MSYLDVFESDESDEDYEHEEYYESVPHMMRQGSRAPVICLGNLQSNPDEDEGSGSHSDDSSVLHSGDSESHSGDDSSSDSDVVICSSDSSDDISCGPLPFDEEHPNMYVPWGMKEYSTDIIEAWTKVHNYALSGSDSSVNIYLSKLSKEVLDQLNHEGETLLYMASFRGLAHVVEDLLKAGASPSKGDSFFDRTPLMTAVQNCHVECVERLLEYADVNEKNSSGFTALFSAAQCGVGRANMEFLDCPHKEENLKLMRPRNKIVLKMLLDKGADVNCSSSIGLTPLLVAVGDDNVTAVQILLEHGADPLATYHDPFFGASRAPINALDKAAENGFKECASLILDKCSSNKELFSRSSAMRLAVKNGHLSCIKCFLSAGFDANLGVKLPPYELATHRESEDAYPLLAAIDTISMELVKYLLSVGASPLHRDVPFRTPCGRCPLYVAFLKSGEVLQLLLERCAEMAGDGQCSGNTTPDFPVDDISVWMQPVPRFKTMLQAGFMLDLEKAPTQEIANTGCLTTFQEVVRMWAKFTDRLSRNLHLPEALNCSEGSEEIPQSLSELCRIAIRRSIGFPRLAKQSLSVQLLPVPQHLQDYLSHV